MLVEKDFLTKLREFGLNTYESKLWIALLSRGVSTAGELSDIAEVPRSRSYDVLEALQRKGFINVKTGKPIRYEAMPPEEVLERRREIVKKKAERHIDLINELGDNKLLSELIALHSKGSANLKSDDLLGAIRSDSNIQNQIGSMLKNAEKSVFICATAKSLSAYYNLLNLLLQKAKARRVDIKIATQISKENEGLVKSLGNFATLKHTGKKARIFIVDKKEVLFMIYDSEEVHKSYDIGIWISSEHLAVALEEALLKEFSTLKS